MVNNYNSSVLAAQRLAGSQLIMIPLPFRLIIHYITVIVCWPKVRPTIILRRFNVGEHFIPSLIQRAKLRWATDAFLPWAKTITER